MLAESFSRYIREFRKPCGKKRNDTIKKLNMKKQYSQINVESKAPTPKKQEMIKAMKTTSKKDKETKQVLEKKEELKKYKKKLQNLN